MHLSLISPRMELECTNSNLSVIVIMSHLIASDHLVVDIPFSEEYHT